MSKDQIVYCPHEGCGAIVGHYKTHKQFHYGAPYVQVTCTAIVNNDLCLICAACQRDFVIIGPNMAAARDAIGGGNGD